MTNSLFDQNSPDVIDPAKDYFTELVGEGKRYATPQEIARGKVEADKHIKTLEKELGDLRQDLAARLTLEQYSDKIAEMINKSSGANQDTQNTGGEEKQVQSKTLSEDDLDKFFDTRITAREQARMKQANVSFVQSELKKVFGDDYSTKITETAESLDLDKESLNKLAERNPKAFLKLFVPTQKQEEYSTHPRSSVVFKPSTSSERNYTFYQEERKRLKDDKRALKRLESQEYQDALRLGQDFFK